MGTTKSRYEEWINENENEIKKVFSLFSCCQDDSTDPKEYQKPIPVQIPAPVIIPEPIEIKEPLVIDD